MKNLFKKINLISNDDTNQSKVPEIIQISGFFSSDKGIKNKKRKLNLPPINFEEFYSNRNYNEEEKFQKPNLMINSCFVPENYKEYSKSCNKYQYKIDPFLKEKLSPKNILIKNRRYDNNERNLISDFKRDEILHRAAGQGMFLRFQSYNTLKKRKPIKIIYNNYNDNNLRYIKKSKIYHKKYNLSQSNKPENTILKYNNYFQNKEERKDHHKIHSFNAKKNNSLETEYLINQIRDNKIISALKRSGNEDLAFYIGPSHIFY